VVAAVACAALGCLWDRVRVGVRGRVRGRVRIRVRAKVRGRVRIWG